MSFEVGNLEAVVDELATDGNRLVGGIDEYENSMRMAYGRGSQGFSCSCSSRSVKRVRVAHVGQSVAYARQPMAS